MQFVIYFQFQTFFTPICLQKNYIANCVERVEVSAHRNDLNIGNLEPFNNSLLPQSDQVFVVVVFDFLCVWGGGGIGFKTQSHVHQLVFKLLNYIACMCSLVKDCA